MEKNFGDDFEFKPLTEGLGFHKKVIDLREEAAAKPPQPKRPTFENPVNRDSKPPTSLPINPTWTPALKEMTMVDRPKTVTKAPGLEKMIPVPLKMSPISVNWPSALFDAAMILGMGLLFSAVVFALIKIDLGELVEMLKTEIGAQVATYLLLVAVFEIYCVTCRSFFGKTLGEWAFDCRLGTIRDQQDAFYPVLVAFRTLLIALTGFIVLPIISQLLGRDIAGLLSGVSLYSEKR